MAWKNELIATLLLQLPEKADSEETKGAMRWILKILSRGEKCPTLSLKGETPTCQMGGGPLKCGDKDLSSLQSYLKAISSQQRNVSFSWIGFAHVVQRNGRAELVQIPLSGWHRQLDYQRCLDKVLLHSIFHVIKSC